MLDKHCHIIYGIDDGAADLKESIAMLHTAKTAGVTGIVATPHVYDETFDFQLAITRKDMIRNQAEELGIQLMLGAEVHWNALTRIPLDLIGQYCIENTNEILIEFNLHGDLPYDMTRRIYKLQRQGLTVLIAHPERYECVKNKFTIALDWLEMGCLLQLDANSLLMPLWSATRNSAIAMLKRGMYACYASDAHNADDYMRLSRASEIIEKNYGGCIG